MLPFSLLSSISSRLPLFHLPRVPLIEESISQMTVEAALSRERSERVLSIQSHVVHGYAGNKCSVLPLQLHGFEVDFINSVQYSNHAGFVDAYNSLPRRYEHVKGQKLTDADLNELYEGLKLNNINNYSHILTGYCGNVDFLRKIADIVADLKNDNGQTLFVCDPVMGDNGRYYVPQDLLPIYRDVIVPLADVLTPNAFELGELTDTKVNTIEDAVRGMDAMHERGVRVVVVTSGIEAAQSEQSLICLASIYDKETKEKKRFKFEFPRLMGQFVGTGDTFTSLLVVWLTELRGDVKEAVRRVLCSMQEVLKKTSGYAQKQRNSNSKAMSELRLVQSRIELLVPPSNDNILIEEL